MVATTDFSQSFRVVNHPTDPTLHRQPGRTLMHNLRRLPSPKPSAEHFYLAVLLGGKGKHSVQRSRSPSTREEGEVPTTPQNANSKRIDEPRNVGLPPMAHSTATGLSPIVSHLPPRPESQAASVRPASQATSLRPLTRQSMTLSQRPVSQLSATRVESPSSRPRTQCCSRPNETAPPRTQLRLCEADRYGPATSERAALNAEALLLAGDYEAPFESEVSNMERPTYVSSELSIFEKRREEQATDDRPATSTLPTAHFTPPKVILMMFRFANVRNLGATKAMRKVGYPELHEQFNIISKGGVITKQQYHQVLSKYLTAAELMECHKIMECFDRNSLGDVDLNMLLIGMQILLECATPGDTMRYCFTLMDPTNKIPRYITRYEVQTLVGYTSAALSETQSVLDKEYVSMSRAIEQLLNEAHRYDYMGRMPLKDFLDALQEKLKEEEKKSVRRLKVRRSEAFVFGKMWGSGPSSVVAAVHRMSSKKMLVASLALDDL